MHLSDRERSCAVCRRPTRRLVNGWPVCVRCRFRRVEAPAIDPVTIQLIPLCAFLAVVIALGAVALWIGGV